MVLRGNSGSGKSTVARSVQKQFDRASCLIVSQDPVRRNMLREHDIAGGVNIELIEAIATWGLARGMVVIAEGIFNAKRYQRMLERLSAQATRSHFFAWDLELAETLRRHSRRPQRESFTPEEMAAWYHGWQPLDFVDETRFTASVTAAEATDLIARAIRA